MPDVIVEMDYTQIRAVADGFNRQADRLMQVMQTIVAATSLCIGEGSAMLAPGLMAHPIALSMVGRLQTMAQSCVAASTSCVLMSQNLRMAIDDHKRGDVQGKAYFGQGIQL